MKVLSMCTGVAGMEMYLPEEFEVVAHMENDKHASAILDYHYPDIPNLGDMYQTGLRIPKADVVMMGTPCTNISTQGNQEGLLKGGESKLFFRAIQILTVVKPQIIIWENVKNVMNINKGKDFEKARECFTTLGYRHDAKIICSSSEFGTNQARERMFLVAVRRESDYSPRDCLMGLGEGLKEVESPKVLDGLEVISWSKSTRKHHTDYRIREDGRINTLTTGRGCNGQSTGNLVVDKGGVRYFTPRECELLQTWPKDWTRYGRYNGEVKEISDGLRYKLIGNGVVSTIPATIMKRLL